MMLKGCGLSKPFIAVFTNVGSLPGVRSHVTSQTCTLSEPLATLWRPKVRFNGPEYLLGPYKYEDTLIYSF